MNLEALSFECRQNVLDMIMEGRAGHIGGDFSVMDILITLYFKQMNISPDNLDDPDRDLFVMSKGHSVEAYYAVLAAKGFLDIEDVIKNFSKFGSPYIGHPNNKLPGIEMNSGSLGHGLPVCVGMALANKMDGKTGRVYTVMGDGELAEGSVWEGAMSAGNYKLDNLCAIVDRNRLQISGNTEDVGIQRSPKLKSRSSKAMRGGSASFRASNACFTSGIRSFSGLSPIQASMRSAFSITFPAMKRSLIS